jgi:hypothetical protein
MMKVCTERVDSEDTDADTQIWRVETVGARMTLRFLLWVMSDGTQKHGESQEKQAETGVGDNESIWHDQFTLHNYFRCALKLHCKSGSAKEVSVSCRYVQLPKINFDSKIGESGTKL